VYITYIARNYDFHPGSSAKTYYLVIVVQVTSEQYFTKSHEKNKNSADKKLVIGRA